MSNNRTPLLAHLSLAGAAVCWGLMSPLGKDAMQNGIDGITLVSLRVMGGAILFWLTSLFTPREAISRKHIALLCLAAVFGLVGNQCCFTIGLSLTSPVNAGIVTTTMPISALLLSAIILKEPITLRKALGVALGCCGAVLLVMSSVRAASGSASVAGLSMGDMRGDLLCFGAQISYTIYLTVFGWLAKRYSIFTVNKWMFLSATCIIWPFTAQHVWQTPWSSLSAVTLGEIGYVVVGGTFLAYILMIRGQQVLRPTVVSMYNYVQPIVAVIVSVILGLAVFTLTHALAVALIFSGVALVTLSKSRRDMLQHQTKNDENTTCVSPVPLMHRLILLLLNTQRNFRLLSSSFLTISALLLTFFSVSPSVAQSTNATKHTLSVHLKGFNDNKGNIVLSVYDSPEHFRKQALQVLRVPTATAQHQPITLSLPAGTYAISVYQDANANGKIDRNLIGIPTELGGFSNNPRIVMGPPSFKRCAFRLEGNLHTTILLH